MLNCPCHSIIAYGLPIHRNDRKKANEILTKEFLDELKKETGVEFISIIPDLSVRCDGLLFVRELSTYDHHSQGITANLIDLFFHLTSKHENATKIIKQNVTKKYGIKLGKENWSYFSWCSPI